MDASLQDLCPAGGSGQGEIERAELMPQLEPKGRVFLFYLIHNQKCYASPCIIQTENWEPLEGDMVRFYRQPQGVQDDYLHAVLLRGGKEEYSL